MSELIEFETKKFNNWTNISIEEDAEYNSQNTFRERIQLLKNKYVTQRKSTFSQ